MSSIGVEQGTLSLVVFQVDKERVRLGNIKPEDNNLVDKFDKSRNEAKFEVLRQLFGYDYIQGIIDGALRDS
jgi:hypothetical protein